MNEPASRLIGRYAISRQIAAGGMATVHLGRLLGHAGFGLTVAIKRLHPHLANQREFVNAFLDEARMAARIQHPNVVATLDVIADDDGVMLVMEYVAGDVLSRILARAAKANLRIPAPIVSGIVVGMLHGLHAAHEARSESGAPLELVHRDVSPQNILVGADGVARVLDFGIAKAKNRLETTRDGTIKGKAAYMAPEQLSGLPVDRRTDVFASGIVLWEALAAARLFTGADHAAILTKILHAEIPRLPRDVATPGLDAILARALARNPAERFATALELATAVEHEIPPATPRVIAEWLADEAAESLGERRQAVSELERELTDRPPRASAGDRVVQEKRSQGEDETLAASSVVPRPRASPALRNLFVIMGLLVIGGIAAGSFTLGAKRAEVGRAAPPAASDTASDLAASASASASRLAADVVPTGDAPPAPDVAPPPRERAPSGTAASTKALAASKTPARAGPQRPPPAVSCDNPYVVDANGIRHIKPECLRP